MTNMIIFYIGEKKKTKVIDNNLDPEWNQVNSCVMCMHVAHYVLQATKPLQCSIGGCGILWLLVFADKDSFSHKVFISTNIGQLINALFLSVKVILRLQVCIVGCKKLQLCNIVLCLVKHCWSV